MIVTSQTTVLPSCRTVRCSGQERTRFTFGPTQLTLPRYPGLDVALIDGPHGFPFPELEYFYIYPNLKLGALLIVDDLHIPTVGRMFEVLKEDAMFEVAAIVATTAFLRRTAAPTFHPHWDCWEDQNFNKRRFGSGGSAAHRASQVASPSTSATSTPSVMHRAFDKIARLASRKSD
jgi:hypothetical protein